MMALRTPALVAVLAWTVTACAPLTPALPDTARPPQPTQWQAPTGTAETVATATVIEARWWQALGDPQLSAWVEQALAHNNDVLAARARIDEARAQVQLAGAAGRPVLDAVLPMSAGRSLGSTGMTHLRSLQPGVQASWEIDLWGRLDALGRAADLRYQASQADRDAIALTVASTTAQAYVGLLSLQAQLRSAQATLVSREHALQLAADQARVGYISQLQLTQAQSEYHSVLQSMESLRHSLARQRNALRILVGWEAPDGAAPGTTVLHWPGEGAPDLQALQLPRLPVALPSQLLERRPDIARAQWQLAAADQSLAAQRASFLPQVRLSASAGSLLINALDYNPATVWSLGGSVLAPLFDAGRLQAQFGVSVAQRDQAAYAYRGVVIQALADVENALAGSQLLQTQMAQAQERQQVLQRSLGFAHDRYQAGYASYLEELDAQRNLFAVQQEVIRLRQSQLDNVIALYQALGGGWQAGGDPGL